MRYFVPIGIFLAHFPTMELKLSRSVSFVAGLAQTTQNIPSGKILDTPIKTSEDLGNIIRERRKKAKLTQQKAAALAGVGNRFLSELERGKPTAQIGKALKVARLLGLEFRIHER